MKRNKNIVVMGYLDGLPSLVAECFGTLSYLGAGGMKVYLALVDASRPLNGTASSSGADTPSYAPPDAIKVAEAGYTPMTFAESVARIIGASIVHTRNFDFQCPSQYNVGLLKQTLELFPPLFVFMPFLGCRNPHQRILAQSSLIACRTIKNVFMYNSDATASFHPSLVSELSAKDVETKSQCLEIISSHYGRHYAPSASYGKSRPNMRAKPAAILARGGSVFLREKERPSKNTTIGMSPETMRKSQECFLIHRLVYF